MCVWESEDNMQELATYFHSVAFQVRSGLMAGASTRGTILLASQLAFTFCS